MERMAGSRRWLQPRGDHVQPTGEKLGGLLRPVYAHGRDATRALADVEEAVGRVPRRLGRAPLSPMMRGRHSERALTSRRRRPSP